MLECLNTIACAVLMLYCVPVATAVSIRRRPTTAVVFLTIVVCFALQVAYPFTNLVPPIPWPATMLNVVAAIGITAWRKDAWALIRSHLGVTEMTVHPLRRVSDFSPRPLSQSEAARVAGRGPQ